MSTEIRRRYKYTFHLVHREWLACYEACRLKELYSSPVSPLEVIERRDGAWAYVPARDRLWTLRNTGALSPLAQLHIALSLLNTATMMLRTVSHPGSFSGQVKDAETIIRHNEGLYQGTMNEGETIPGPDMHDSRVPYIMYSRTGVDGGMIWVRKAPRVCLANAIDYYIQTVNRLSGDNSGVVLLSESAHVSTILGVFASMIGVLGDKAYVELGEGENDNCPKCGKDCCDCTEYRCDCDDCSGVDDDGSDLSTYEEDEDNLDDEDGDDDDVEDGPSSQAQDVANRRGQEPMSERDRQIVRTLAATLTAPQLPAPVNISQAPTPFGSSAVIITDVDLDAAIEAAADILAHNTRITNENERVGDQAPQTETRDGEGNPAEAGAPAQVGGTGQGTGVVVSDEVRQPGQDVPAPSVDLPPGLTYVDAVPQLSAEYMSSWRSACYSPARLHALYVRPRTPLQILVLREDYWSSVSIQDRLWTLMDPHILSKRTLLLYLNLLVFEKMGRDYARMTGIEREYLLADVNLFCDTILNGDRYEPSRDPLSNCAYNPMRLYSLACMRPNPIATRFPRAMYSMVNCLVYLRIKDRKMERPDLEVDEVLLWNQAIQPLIEMLEIGGEGVYAH